MPANDIDLDDLLKQQERGQNTADDDQEDLSKADRGNAVGETASEEVEEEEEQEEEEASEKKQPRDKKGRFDKKDEAAEEEEEEEEADDKKKKTKSEAVEEEEEEEEEDDKNLSLRLNKMKDQRDRDRERADRLQREIDELRKTKAPEKEEPKVDPVQVLKDEIGALYEQVEELRADGNTKAAAKLQMQIDEKREEIAELKAQKVAGKVTAQATENARYDALLEQIEGAIPELDPNHEDFDGASVKALEWHTAAYEKMGLSATQALRGAAKMLFGYGEKKAEPAKKSEPEKKVEPKKTDIKKVLDNKKKQPPDGSTAGTDRGDETKLDPTRMTEEQFDALPESKKKLLRGDLVS